MRTSRMVLFTLFLLPPVASAQEQHPTLPDNASQLWTQQATIKVFEQKSCGASQCLYDYEVYTMNGAKLIEFNAVPAINGGLQIFDANGDGKNEYAFELLDLNLDSIPNSDRARFPLYVCMTGNTPFDCTGNAAKEILTYDFRRATETLSRPDTDAGYSRSEETLSYAHRTAILHILAIVWYLGKDIEMPELTPTQNKYAISVLPKIISLMNARLTAILPPK